MAAQVIKLKRTFTADNPPATLAEGELAAGLADYPIRMWIGTPTGVQELFAGTAIEDAESDAVYGRSNGDWVKTVVVDTFPPSTHLVPGRLWWDTDSAQLFVWTGAQWVIATNTAKRGPQGLQGIQGIPGERGETGIQGHPGGNFDSRLFRSSTTELRMSPGFIKINGVMRRIPNGGDIGANATNAEVNGVPGQALAPDTNYLVFARDDGSVPVASFRTGATHETSATLGNEGVEVLSGNDNESLIGFIRTTDAAQFVDEPQRRFVRSWRKDPGLVLVGRFSTMRQILAAAWTELHTEIRVQWLSFAGEIVDLLFNGSVSTPAGTPVNNDTAVGIDSTSVPADGSSQGRIVYGDLHLHSVAPRGLARVSEGYHFATVLGRSNGVNNVTWSGLWDTTPVLSGSIAPRP